MQNKFKVIDESGDRKYFTIVPNYIVNHSTPYEQAIYLYMKRVAGETGTCWTSAQEIAQKLGCSRNTIAKYRNKLLKRGWIEKVGVKRIGTTSQPTPEYKIVDLWNLNSQFYQEKQKGSNNDTLRGKGSPDDKRVQPATPSLRGKGSPVVHKEELKKNQEEEVCFFLKEWNEKQSSPVPAFVPENIVRKHGAEKVAGLLEEYGQRDKGFSSFLQALKE